VPGSWHDSQVALPIYEKVQSQTSPRFYLVADMAFPHGTNQIARQIQAPLKSGQCIPGTKEEVQAALDFNCQLLSYRQTAEWENWSLQGFFGHLQILLNVKHAESRADLLEICLHLHNLQCHHVSLNQIQTVYIPQWHQAREAQWVWEYAVLGTKEDGLCLIVPYNGCIQVTCQPFFSLVLYMQ